MKKYPDHLKMKIIPILSFLLIISCSSDKNKNSDLPQNQTRGFDSISAIGQNQISSVDQPDSVDYSKLDSAIEIAIKKLSEKYSWIPYYGKISNHYFYIISNRRIDYETPLFTGLVKYGLVDSVLSQILDTVYDKISNPDLVIKDCFEISIGSKVGLYNYRTKEILQPQFDYILPSLNEISGTAYGFKNGTFYSIKNSKLNNYTKENVDPVPILKTLRFDVLKIGSSMMFDSYFTHYYGDPDEGKAVVIIPSYLKYFKFFNKDGYTDIILPDQQKSAAFGTGNVKLNTSFLQKLKSLIMTFLVDTYESGVDGRGYVSESKNLVIFNENKNIINSVKLWKVGDNQDPCIENDYKILGDSLIEIRKTERDHQSTDNLYRFELRYSYYRFMEDGSIKHLTSNRHFMFTKFVLINDSYFYGCFAKDFSDSEKDENNNMWQSDHLSLDDLDLMRNEIFAEYGLKFKSEKWQKYFSEKSWYSPKYDDVNDKLTAIDRANLKVIIARQELLKKDEQKYTHKRPIGYYPAG